MELEQTQNVTIQENSQAEDKQPESETKQDDWKAPTHEEYEKAIQSTASKAKYQLLQELGIKSVDDFKNLSNTYQSAIKEVNSLKESNEKYSAQISQLNEEIVVNKLGVLDEHKDDFLTLAKAKVTSDKDFTTAANEVLEKNPYWRKTNESIKMGTEKSADQPAKSNLSKKYSWIKD